MRPSVIGDRIFATCSWIIVVALLFGVVTLFFVDPSGNGPVAQLVGITAAKWFYILVYGTEASVLGYAKVKKKKNLRKHALVAIYLTAIFTGILTLMLGGISPNIIDNAVLFVLSGGCWLWWKFKTEYINPDEFNESLLTLREDNGGYWNDSERP